MSRTGTVTGQNNSNSQITDNWGMRTKKTANENKLYEGEGEGGCHTSLNGLRTCLMCVCVRV